MEPKKIAYIAGSLNISDINNTESKYQSKQEDLEALGYIVYNPVIILKHINEERATMGLHTLDGTDPNDKNKITSFSISLMSASDELHLLSDWQENESALKEQTIANLIPMSIIYP